MLPYSHHCGLDEGHPGLHKCMACAQLPGGQVDAVRRVGGRGAARPELVTAECGPFWAHEDCNDPTCTCHCHEASEPSNSDHVPVTERNTP